MSKINKLFVGNLNYSIKNEDLSQLFSQYGKVVDSVVIMDRETQRSKGFGFITFNTADEAKKAIEALNGKEFQGRNLVVNEARPRQ